MPRTAIRRRFSPYSSALAVASPDKRRRSAFARPRPPRRRASASVAPSPTSSSAPPTAIRVARKPQLLPFEPASNSQSGKKITPPIWQRGPGERVYERTHDNERRAAKKQEQSSWAWTWKRAQSRLHTDPHPDEPTLPRVGRGPTTRDCGPTDDRTAAPRRKSVLSRPAGRVQRLKSRSMTLVAVTLGVRRRLIAELADLIRDDADDAVGVHSAFVLM